MKWIYTVAGGHTHVKVYMNGAKCGDLCFRNEEFVEVKDDHDWLSKVGGVPLITFIEEPTHDPHA